MAGQVRFPLAGYFATLTISLSWVEDVALIHLAPHIGLKHRFCIVFRVRAVNKFRPGLHSPYILQRGKKRPKNEPQYKISENVSMVCTIHKKRGPEEKNSQNLAMRHLLLPLPKCCFFLVVVLV